MPQSQRPLSVIPKPTIGPMRTQSIDHASIMLIQVRPVMPTVGMVKNAPQPKQKTTRTEAVRAAKARMTRRASLRKQREALKDKSSFGQLSSGVDFPIQIVKV